MFPVTFSNNTAIIKFNSNFYDMYSISEICEKFQHLCKIKMEYIRDKELIEVTITPKVDVNLKELAFEFCNHVLYFQVKG